MSKSSESILNNIVEKVLDEILGQVRPGEKYTPLLILSEHPDLEAIYIKGQETLKELALKCEETIKEMARLRKEYEEYCDSETTKYWKDVREYLGKNFPEIDAENAAINIEGGILSIRDIGGK